MAYTYQYNVLLTLLDGTTELSKENFAETKQAMTEFTKQLISIVDDTVDEVISLGGVATAKMVLIQSTQSVSIKFNDLSALVGKFFFLKDVAVTDITVSNDSGSTALLTVLVSE